jgi:ribosomal protein S18 acetylase RimI-like enzyme
MVISEIPGDRVPVESLAELLKDAVDDGASVGFLPPLDLDQACWYWRGVAGTIAAGERVLLVATDAGRLAGTVQLDLCHRANGLHRAEVLRLLVHTTARRRGIGRKLMTAVEEAAWERQRTLLVLDTRDGDASCALYESLGYIRAGVVPRYARSASGELHGTAIYYKELAGVSSSDSKYIAAQSFLQAR